MILHEEMGEELFDANAAGETMYEADYETERNKPKPNITHAAVQAVLITFLRLHYGSQYLFVSEVSLATSPSSTPDLCVFPKRKIDIKTATAKETEVPITTIEIISPSQSINEMMHKAWDIYFPIGVQSAWIVVPELKAIQLLLPNDEQQVFYKGMLTDPATGIQIDIEKVFEDLV